MLTELPFARFMQMLRVINQQENNDRAWDLYVAGASKKDESFDRYARRVGAESRTPPSEEEQQVAAAATVEAVKSRLGSLYRPPIQA